MEVAYGHNVQLRIMLNVFFRVCVLLVAAIVKPSWLGRSHKH
jgi:hypothetical protein